MTSQPASVFARPSYIASQPHLQSHAVSAAASLPSRYSPVPRYPGSRAPSASPAPSNASLQSAGSTIKRTSKQSAAPEHSRSIHSPAISRRQTSHHLIPLPEPVPPRPSRPHKQPQHAQQQPPPAYHHQEQHRQQQGASDGSPGMVEAPAPVSVSPSGSDREDQTAAGHGDEGEDSARDFIPVAKIESIAPDPPAKRPAQRRSTRAAPSPAAKAGGGSKKRNAAAAAAAAAAEFEDDAERDEDDDDDEDDEKEKISPAEAARRQQERAKAEGFDLTDPAQRKRWLLLERNRRAAQKCRQRKKVRIQGLQGSIDKLAQDNAELMEQAVALREQVLHLKSLLLANRDCPVASGNGIDFQAIESTLTTTLRSIY
ncbi:hypothetical protein DFJ73DRAFT_811296 [Zopfochytrium polystomum]|nr:hypothetical protein DFJ73DRAFT_811296 [Zopfochytrium polystomum]